jgi:hypothetical protein
MAKGQKTGGRQPGSLNKTTREVKELAGKHGPDAIAKLAHLMQHAESEQAQVAAAKELLDRAYGKSPQAIVGDADADPIQQVINIVTGVPRAE